MSSFRLTGFALAVASVVSFTSAAQAQQGNPNDPEFSRQWYLKKNQPNQIDIGITGAWQHTHGPVARSWFHLAMIDGGAVDIDTPI